MIDYITNNGISQHCNFFPQDKYQKIERDLSPMVQISIKEYDRLKERTKYITDKDMIAQIDKIEFFVKELRKHIVRTDI